MSELWIAHHSICNWQEAARWTTYFEQAQLLFNLPLTHLDVNDPIKRKVSSLVDAGGYVCTFKPQEDSRWLFGKFGNSGIEFSIQHYRRLGHYSNTLKWHVPLPFVESADHRELLKALFALGNKTFHPFYAYSDEVVQISSKKKSTGAVNIQAELLGVFWLTYFNAAYVRFFGKDRFAGLSGVQFEADGGITIVLGDSPHSVTGGLREGVTSKLGAQSFVNSADIITKAPGRFALTFQQMVDEPTTKV